MLIRVAQPADMEQIGQLWLQLVSYHRDLDAIMPEAAPDGAQRYAARLTSLLHDPHNRTFVAVEGDTVIGYVTGMIVDMRPEMFVEEVLGFIGDIFVDPAHRGRGVGRALVRAMEQFFASRGVFQYEWFVATANQDGQSFWRKLGAREVVIRMRNQIRSHESEDEL